MDEGRLAGRSALITGGASGFGKATALRFARQGALVTIADLSDGGDQVAAEIAPDARFVRCDVADAQQVAAAVAGVVERHGRLDVIVNNAGVLGGGWIHEGDADHHLRRQIDVNIVGVWNGCRAALAVMRPQRGGVILNTASPAGQVPTPGAVAYGLTKAAVLHMTQSLALAYAPDQVRVNAVLPGPALTGIFALDPEKRPELERQYAANVPLGRVADVDDIAAAMEYLASDDASFVTGAILNVDGFFRPKLPPKALS
jgi:NAD(P)-dependent dehydrogenase (short-subunit alcohol dehydrogenase family)